MCAVAISCRNESDRGTDQGTPTNHPASPSCIILLDTRRTMDAGQQQGDSHRFSMCRATPPIVHTAASTSTDTGNNRASSDARIAPPTTDSTAAARCRSGTAHTPLRKKHSQLTLNQFKVSLGLPDTRWKQRARRAQRSSSSFRFSRRTNQPVFSLYRSEPPSTRAGCGVSANQIGRSRNGDLRSLV